MIRPGFSNLRLAVALAMASLFFVSLHPARGQATAPTVVWQYFKGIHLVQVKGLPAETLQRLTAARLSTADWQKLLPVSVENKDIVASVELPPMLGRYSLHNDVLEFFPAYPLTPEVKYRATLHLDRLPGWSGKAPLLTATLMVPPRKLEPSTVVQQVYPTADVLPENLLKFYLHFSGPMSGGNIYEHIHLLNESGQAVELPFLEIDEELWNPGMTRLTLFIDPGRIKRDVKPLEEVGPALQTGKTYTLVIDKGWQDADGQPLKASFHKVFKVSAPDREALDQNKWQLTAPAVRSREPLKVNFGKPLDHALAERMLHVLGAGGKPVAGKVTLREHEQQWLFTPEKMWTDGKYQLLVQTTIEDLAGNNIGKPFEVDLFHSVDKQLTHETVTLPFSIR